MKNRDLRLAIIGLGYVGLPLAVEFGKKFPVIGFDIDKKRIDELESGKDITLETSGDELREAEYLRFTVDPADLKSANCYIITVPTPIDEHKRPNLLPLILASRTIGEVLDPGDIVIYESTVFPGATEEICAPILEKHSGLKYISSSPNNDSSAHISNLRGLTEPSSAEGSPGPGVPGFYLGYSPERINPGDKEHRITTVKKVTSGSTTEIAQRIDDLYNEIVTAGTYKAESIRVAEAAKVIENTQRDLNIALVNELAMIFNKMGIDTDSVLRAAGSKWNFLPFRPGLVGGHCIGVDPYYLTHKAQAIGYNPEIILAGRRVNDGMAEYVATQLIKLMVKRSVQIQGARVLIMGLAFKENCPDIRNSRIVEVVRELSEYKMHVDIFDPWVNTEEAEREYDIRLIAEPKKEDYDSIMIAVAHNQFRALGPEGIRAFGKNQCVVYDIKHILPADFVDQRL